MDDRPRGERFHIMAGERRCRAAVQRGPNELPAPFGTRRSARTRAHRATGAAPGQVTDVDSRVASL